MLRGINPILTGDLLKALDEMGHADQLALVDRNYPSHSSERPVIHLGSITVLTAAEALLSVFPLDSFVQQPLMRMQTGDDEITPTQQKLLEIARKSHSTSLEYQVIPRMDFYEAVKNCRIVIQCLEDAPYSCFILQKGVV